MSETGCAIEDSPLKMRRKCFTKRADGSGFDKKGDSGCQNAELVEKDGFLYQKGGPPMSMKSTCQKGWMFAMPYEVSFVLNFTVIDNLPRGCGLLDGEWRLNKWRPYKETWLNKIYNGNNTKHQKICMNQILKTLIIFHRITWRGRINQLWSKHLCS